MKPRNFRDYAHDIITEIEHSREFVKGMSFEEFQKDEKTSHACIRCLEVIGEASKKIPNPIKDKHPNIPWKEIAGTRDVERG